MDKDQGYNGEGGLNDNITMWVEGLNFHTKVPDSNSAINGQCFTKLTMTLSGL